MVSIQSGMAMSGTRAPPRVAITKMIANTEPPTACSVRARTERSIMSPEKHTAMAATLMST